MDNASSELNLPHSVLTKTRGRSHFGLLPLLVWSALVATSLFFSLQNLKDHSLELSLAQGRALFHLAGAMQIWNSGHVGIHVLKTDRNPPSPYLDKSIRSNATISARKLPLLNSCYMTRQIAGAIERESGIRLHLTSLTPLNPENKADASETLALNSFTAGSMKEVLSVGDGIARYMAPLYMKPECTSCHTGYKPGDVGGGLCIQWSVMPTLQLMRSESQRSIAAHLLVWLLVSALMVIATRTFLKNQVEISRLQADLSALNANFEATVKARARQLLASMHKLRTISDNAPGIVYQYLLRPDGSSAIPYANERFYEVFGLRPEQVHNDAAPLLDQLHPDDLAEFLSTTRLSAMQLTPWQHEFRILDTAGHERWLFGNTVPQRGENGMTLWNGFITDISERKRAEAEMRRHKAIIDTAQDGFWMVDQHGNLQEVNQAYAQMTGYTTEELLKMHVSDLDASEQSEEFKTHIDTLFTVGHDILETRHRHKDGHLIDIEMSATYLRELKTFFVFCRDITKRKEYEKALQQSENRYRELADYDVLTKLPNRRLLADRLGAALAISQRNGCFGALMLLDLDNFKPLNDLHGHDMGDLLLQEVADRLKKCVREVDTVARIGGDEFVVVLSELNQNRQKSHEQAMLIAEKIRNSLSAPYVLPLLKQNSQVTHHCSASIGVALFAGHEYTQEDIFKWADIAMYQAKNAGRNRIHFYQQGDSDGNEPSDAAVNKSLTIPPSADESH